MKQHRDAPTSTKTKTKTTTIAAAYHEAGHVTALHVFGLEPRSASIIETEDAHGTVSFGIGLTPDDLDGELDREQRDRVDSLVMSYLAGVEAQRIHRKTSVRSAHMHFDVSQAITLLELCCGSPKQVEQRLGELRKRIRAELLSNWYVVEAVATALVAAGQLNQTQIATVIRESLMSEFLSSSEASALRTLLSVAG